jgi:hypothetical protein
MSFIELCDSFVDDNPLRLKGGRQFAGHAASRLAHGLAFFRSEQVYDLEQSDARPWS